MKQNLRLLLLTLLCAVVSGVWATEVTWTHTFSTTEKTFTEDGTEELSDMDWTLSVDWSGEETDYNFDNTKGMKIGSNSKVPNSLTLSSSAFSNYTIQSISITVAGRSRSSLLVSASVGEAEFDSQTITNGAELQTITFEASESISGDISITVAQNNNTKGAIYVSELTVVYNDNASSGPEAPTFTPPSGTSFSESLEVSISSTTEGAKIYYTTDGSQPSSESTEYAAPFTINKTTTIRAIAIVYDAATETETTSSVITATYKKIVTLTTMSNEMWAFGSELQELTSPLKENTVVNDKMEISQGAQIMKKDEGIAMVDGITFTTRLNLTQYQWLHIKVAANSVITFYSSSSGSGERTLQISSDQEGTAIVGSLTIPGGQDTYKAYSFEYTGSTESDLYFKNTKSGGCYFLGVKVEPKSNEIKPVLTATDVKIEVGKTASSTITAKNGEEEIEGLTYTYEVTSGSDFASVDEDGVVTGIAIGSAVVTVTSAAIEGQYQSATTTFKVTVTEYVTASGVYKKVTSTDQLEAGKEYIIVAYDAEGNPLNYAMGDQNGNFRNRVSAKVLTSNGEDYVTITDNDAVTKVILGGNTGAWTFCTYDEKDYLCLPSANNYLKTEATVSTRSKWTIKDDLTIWNNSNDAYTLQYNSTAGQERFSCYKNTQKPTFLFVKVESIPVDITKVGYGTLYYSDKDLIVPSGVKAMTYKLTTSGDDIRVYDTYEAGEVIPKDCGVVLQVLTTSENTQTFYFAEGIAEDNAPEDNLLLGLDEGGTTIGPDGSSEGYIFYMLSTDKNGENVGFYWKNGGAPFTTKAHKAYLAIPKSAGVNASSFVFDDLTGICAIMSDSAKNAEGIYTLSGMRIDGKQLPKGIYIVNGKKMVIK